MLRRQLEKINPFLPTSPTKEYPMCHLTYLIYYHVFYFISIHIVRAVSLLIFVCRKCFNKLFVKQFWNLIPRMKRKLFWGIFLCSNPIKLVIMCVYLVPLTHPVQLKRKAQNQRSPQMSLQHPCSVWANLLQLCWPARQSGASRPANSQTLTLPLQRIQQTPMPGSRQNQCRLACLGISTLQVWTDAHS